MGVNNKLQATYHGGEYTPSTDVVLAAYMECEKRHVRTPDEKAISAFDRWIDQIRAEAKAEAWDEGWCVGWGNAWDSAKLTGTDLVMSGNPYKENQK